MTDLFAVLQSSPFAFALVAILFGLVIGSFLNVVILRLPAKLEQEWQAYYHEYQQQQLPPGSDTPEQIEAEDPRTWFGLRYLITPASTCPNCGHQIRAWENIPVLSYLLLRGRCSNCKTRIGIRYPIVELLTAILTLVVAMHFGLAETSGWALGGALLFTWFLIALSVIDIDHQQLPDQLTLPLVWIGLLLNTFGLFTDLPSAVIGAAAAYLFLWFLYHVFVTLTGKEGMGYGDFKLFAAFGAWFGWQMLPQILLIASVIGALVGIGLIVIRGRDRNLPIPFGPYLAGAGWVALLWGAQINSAYLGLAGFN